VCDDSGYDAINRPTIKSYADGTPAVSNRYDSHATGCPSGTDYPILRLTAVSNSVSATTFDCLDALGRVTQSSQNTPLASSTPYTFQYIYNQAGQLTQETYPSGRVVTTAYDAAGRPNGLTGSGGKTYVGSVMYAAHGAITAMQLNNGGNLTEETCFNSRLQPGLIRQRTGTAAPSCTNSPGPDSSDLLHLKYTYGASSTTSHGANNGDILGQVITSLATQQVFSQSYTYDNVDRLARASRRPSASRRSSRRRPPP